MRLLEVTVALMVGFGLLAVGWGVLARSAMAGRTLLARSEMVEVERLTPWVLERELAGARPLVDWADDPDGLSLRVFRGAGVRCGPAAGADPEAEVVVGYRGLRQPEPDKDSLELTHADGRRSVVRLASVTTLDAGEDDGACAPGTRPLRLRWLEDEAASGARPGARVVLVRVYERGLYAVDDAFRYRRGAGGRQPLTVPVLDPGRSLLEAGGGEPRLELVRAGASGAGAVRVRVFTGWKP